jgi:hypothetical protein
LPYAKKGAIVYLMSERYTAELDREIVAEVFDVSMVQGSYVQTSMDQNGRHEQKTGFTLVTPAGYEDKAGPLFVMTCSWSEYSAREPQLDRQRAIAGFTGVPVISVDMPGQSPNSSPLTPEQRGAVAHGNFGLLADRLWNTVEYGAKRGGIDLSNKELVVFGMSQGATLAAAMYEAQPQTTTISDVVLWNTPSFTSPQMRSSLKLAKDFLRFGGTDFSYYADLNPVWAYREGLADSARFVQHLGGLVFAPISGMAHAKTDNALFETIARRSSEAEQPRIHIVHAGNDNVSPDWSNELAEGNLEVVHPGEVRRVQQDGEYHGVTNCLAAVAMVADEVVEARY